MNFMGLLAAIGIFLSTSLGLASSLRLDARRYYSVEQFLGAAEITAIRQIDASRSGEDLSRQLQAAIKASSTKSIFVTKVFSETGGLLGLTLLIEDGGAVQPLATHRLFAYLPDQIVFTEANTGSLRSLIEVNLEQARSDFPSRLPTLILGPSQLFPAMRVEPMHQLANEAIERFQRFHQITRDLGFHVHQGRLPRITPAFLAQPRENGTGNPGADMTARAMNSFPRVELDREQGALLAAYRWFGTLRYGQSSATHYFSRRDQHYIEIADLFRELSPESAAVLERFPEFNSARLSQGIQFDNLDGRALLISAFHSARSPRSAQFSLLVQVAQELGSQENRAMLAAIEHLIQRELPYPARPVNPSATAGERLAVEFVVQAQSPEQERAVIAEIESQLRARGVAAAIETMGMALAFRSESVSRAGAAVTVANETMPWREFRFAGTPAADRAHLIIHEDGRAQIMEPRTHRIEGSTYVRWHTVFDFFLLNPNEGAVEALTSRRIVVRYPGHEVQLIRGPGGWRAELNDTCHRLMLGQDGAA